MPYDAFGRLLNQDEEQPGLSQSPVGGGVSGGGASPTPSQPIQQGAQQQAASGQPGIGVQDSGSMGSYVPGSTFVNFGQWMQGNKGKAAASAQKLSDSANAQAKQASGDLANAQTGFNSAVASGSEAYNPGSLTQAGGKHGGGTGDPGAVTPQEMQRRANATYTGPNSFSDYMGSKYGDLTGETQKAADYANNLSTAGGVMANMGYTGSTGKSRLDAGLAQGAGGGAFADLAKKYGGLMGNLTDQSTAADARAAEAAGETSDAAKLYQSQLDAYNNQQAPTKQNLGVSLNNQGAGLNSVQSSGPFDHPGTGGNVQLKDIQGNLDKYEPGIAQGAKQYGVDDATVRSTLQNMTPQQYAQWEADPAGFWTSIAKQKG